MITEICVILKYTKLISSQACFPHKMALLQLVNKLQFRNGFAQVCFCSEAEGGEVNYGIPNNCGKTSTQ